LAVRAEHFLAISADTADVLFVVEATAMQINPASPGANFILANMVDCLRGCWAFMKPGMSRQGNIVSVRSTSREDPAIIASAKKSAVPRQG
jgi:hypothetical protein